MKMLFVGSFLTLLKVKHPPGIFSLPQASITSWNTFETTFIEKFGEDKSPTTLVL
jgi:hypothetical protein